MHIEQKTRSRVAPALHVAVEVCQSRNRLARIVVGNELLPGYGPQQDRTGEQGHGCESQNGRTECSWRLTPVLKPNERQRERHGAGPDDGKLLLADGGEGGGTPRGHKPRSKPPRSSVMGPRVIDGMKTRVQR